MKLIFIKYSLKLIWLVFLAYLSYYLANLVFVSIEKGCIDVVAGFHTNTICKGESPIFYWVNISFAACVPCTAAWFACKTIRLVMKGTSIVDDEDQ